MRHEIIEVPGARLHLELSSDDPDTIFVHGFGGDMNAWDELWEILPDECQPLRYDLRGFGRSEALRDEPFHHAADLLALMNALQIKRCNLVGVSMGGSIALNFALSYPSRVRSLVLLSPGLTAWEWSDEWQMLWLEITSAARSGDMPAAKRLWLSHPLFRTTLGRCGEDALRREISRFSGAQWIKDHQDSDFPDLERLHELSVPALMLTGAHDLPEFRLIADLIDAAISDLVRFDAADLGHMLHLEDPLWCRDRISAFWSSDALEKESAFPAGTIGASGH